MVFGHSNNYDILRIFKLTCNCSIEQENCTTSDWFESTFWQKENGNLWTKMSHNRRWKNWQPKPACGYQSCIKIVVDNWWVDDVCHSSIEDCSRNHWSLHIGLVIRLFWSQNFKHRSYGGCGLRLLIVDQSIITICMINQLFPTLFWTMA